MNHDNINVFAGVCPEGRHRSIVMEYCRKESLINLLAKRDTVLDWNFRSSFIADIVKVREYNFLVCFVETDILKRQS